MEFLLELDFLTRFSESSKYRLEYLKLILNSKFKYPLNFYEFLILQYLIKSQKSRYKIRCTMYMKEGRERERKIQKKE